jgi:hypothetical protein
VVEKKKREEEAADMERITGELGRMEAMFMGEILPMTVKVVFDFGHRYFVPKYTSPRDKFWEAQIYFGHKTKIRHMLKLHFCAFML